MSGVRIKISAPFFRTIRENSKYYVDKTAFIEEFLKAEPPEASLITRPRRFIQDRRGGVAVLKTSLAKSYCQYI